MPRTRTISDQDILQATILLVSTQGVDKLTFAALGAQLGLSPSTLVQRFGTKQQLLIATTSHCLQDMETTFRISEEHQPSPLAAIFAAFEALTKGVAGVKEFANGQVFFYLALTNPETYALLRSSMQAACEQTARLLDKAVAAGELRPCDTKSLALTLQTTYEGSITTWLAYQEGGVGAWVTDRLAAALAPYVITK